jgi:hypothetical protein
MIPSRHEQRDLFAGERHAASCEHCREALERREVSVAPENEKVDAKALVANFLERIGNQSDVVGWAGVLDDNPSVPMALERLGRLHEFFPMWRVAVDELIAEGDRVVARYRVAYTDPFNLLGTAALAVRTDQVVIVGLRGRKIIEFRGIVDDFGVWTEGRIEEFAHTRRHAYELAARGSPCGERLYSSQEELP